MSNEIHKLKEKRGTFKGIIGECLFKLTRKKLILTQYCRFNKWNSLYGTSITNEQKCFLKKEWYSLDGIEVIRFSDLAQITLFEVKTRNRYRKSFGFKPKMTENTHRLYQQAKDLGFSVKLATVWLEDNWNYSVKITDFNSKYYCIDKPKQYDKKY